MDIVDVSDALGSEVVGVDLREPLSIDRVRMVFGFDATSTPRPGAGRSYAIAWSPVHYSLEASDDGRRFTVAAMERNRIAAVRIEKTAGATKEAEPQVAGH